MESSRCALLRKSGVALRLVVVCWVLAAAPLVPAATTTEDVERLLPDDTLIYVGVPKIGETADAVVARIDGVVQGEKGVVFEMLEALQRGIPILGTPGVTTISSALQVLGCDPQGSGGFAVLGSAGNISRGAPILVIVPSNTPDAVWDSVLAGLAPALREETSRLCRAQCSEFGRIKRDWYDAHPQAANAPTLAELQAFDPATPRMRCPSGGEYVLGKKDEDVKCTKHDGGNTRFDTPLTRENLKRRQFGAATVVGGLEDSFAYACTPTHVLISNHPDAVLRAVACLEGNQPRAKLAPATVPQPIRSYFNTPLLTSMLIHEMIRDFGRGREGAPNAAALHVKDLVGSLGPATLDVLMRPDGADVRATVLISDNEAVRPILATAPSPLGAINYVPGNALCAFGSNLVQRGFSVTGDVALAQEPAAGAVLKLVGLLLGPDGAFALAPGTISPQGEFPNIVIVGQVRDQASYDNLERTLLALFERNLRVAPEGTSVQGLRVQTLKEPNRAPGEGVAFHWMRLGDYVVVSTDLDALRNVVQANTGEVRRKQQVANVIAKCNFPALLNHINRIETQQTAWFNMRSCVARMETINRRAEEFRNGMGRAPADMAELARYAEAHNQEKPDVRCPLGAEITVDPRTGLAVCPNHGTVAAPKQADPPERRDAPITRRLGEELGNAVLSLRFEAGAVVIDGSLRKAAKAE